MSNKKVRMALEQKERTMSATNKAYDVYKKKEDLLLSFQMVRAYYGDNGASIPTLVTKILKEKYNLPWQDKIIRNAVEQIKGQRDAVLVIPQFKYEKKVSDILSVFVKRKFGAMMVGANEWDNIYPLAFKEIVRKYS